MIHSIRWRIGVSVFILIGALHVCFSVLVMEQLNRNHRNEIDDHLLEGVAHTIEQLGTPELVEFVRLEDAQNNKWNESFYEIRDASGRLVVASKNVPKDGLGASIEPKGLSWRHRQSMPAVEVWERIHPASHKGHVRIRVVEARKGDYTIRVAQSLKRKQKTYWRLREQLLWSLLVVGFLASGGAWWVARRSLAPIGAITNQAQKLGGTSEGQLPRTGSGDELDRLAEVLNQMLGRLRTEMMRVRRMSADAAHALRTPLAGVRGTLELHLRRLGPGDDAEDLLPALEGIDESVQFVNRLLLLERIEGMAIDRSRWRDLQLDVLVHDLAEAMSIVAQDRHLDLKSQTEPLTIYGDATQLRNAILNMIDNALRHTPPGGRIDVSVQRDGEHAVVAVQDSGPGLRPDQIERAFERFYSEREDGVVGGLGLPIARAIAQAHGGSLDVSPEAPSRFELRLPLSSLRVIE